MSKEVTKVRKEKRINRETEKQRKIVHSGSLVSISSPQSFFQSYLRNLWTVTNQKGVVVIIEEFQAHL